MLGGTFNPPHVGHLVCAQEARFGLGLARVILVPVREPPHKEALADPGPEVRLEMCRLATRDEPGVEVSAIEVERDGPSYTVDTLRALHAREPEHALTFILGGDMALSFASWREPEEIVRLARLGVASREDTDPGELASALAPVPGAAAQVDIFSMPRLDVSSSDIRARVGTGAPIRHLVPDAVASQIARDGLYA